MAPNPRRIDTRLEELYAKLPKIDCQGYCHHSCGPLAMSLREQQRIEEAAGERPECPPGGYCSMLTDDKRCSVYEIRPMVCRLWGLVEQMPCRFGCVPEGGLMSDEEGRQWLAEADAIGGTPADRIEHLRREMGRYVAPPNATLRRPL
jgi:hypothetical protein